MRNYGSQISIFILLEVIEMDERAYDDWSIRPVFPVFGLTSLLNTFSISKNLGFSYKNFDFANLMIFSYYLHLLFSPIR